MSLLSIELVDNEYNGIIAQIHTFKLNDRSNQIISQSSSLHKVAREAYMDKIMIGFTAGGADDKII